MKKKKKKLKIAAFLSAVLLLVVVLFIMGYWEKNMEIEIDTQEIEDGTAQKRNVETILVIGLDKYQTGEDAVGYINDQQADFLLLVIMDRENKVCDLLQINRDTMAEIQRLGIGGGPAGTFTGQLALSHTFGSGGSDSCINTKKAVSKFLNGIRIDHYISLTMDAVGIINDIAGGVTLEIMDDFSNVDPELVQGETMTLLGEHALHYVRYRSGLEDSSNLHRMERQRQYISGLYDQIQRKKAEDPDFMMNALVKASPYMMSDYTINQLSAMSEELEDCKVNPIITIPGETVKGTEFMEFYADKEALDKIIQQLFYIQ